MDIRVAYIKFQLEYPLSISLFNTSILVAISLSGLFIEKNKRCTPDLRLWLVIILFRSVIRLVSRFYAEAVSRYTENSLRMDVQIAIKVVDMLDIFGIVWFAVGNLLVFNNFPCINVAPIVFFSCLSYIVLSYINFFLPTIIRCTIRGCPPSRREDIEYMELTSNTVGLLRNQPIENQNIHTNNSSELTEDRSVYWTNWLQSYGCYEVSYNQSMNLNNNNRAAESHVDDDDFSSNTCTICLSLFEHIPVTSVNNIPGAITDTDDEQQQHVLLKTSIEFDERNKEINSENIPREESNTNNESEKTCNNNIIVRYPCHGHHYFHAHCLKSWLQVATIQYQNNLQRRGIINRQNEYIDVGEQVTCPNCREHPIREVDV